MASLLGKREWDDDSLEKGIVRRKLKNMSEREIRDHQKEQNKIRAKRSREKKKQQMSELTSRITSLEGQIKDLTMKLDKEKKKNLFYSFKGDITKFEEAYERESTLLKCIIEKMQSSNVDPSSPTTPFKKMRQHYDLRSKDRQEDIDRYFSQIL